MKVLQYISWQLDKNKADIGLLFPLFCWELARSIHWMRWKKVTGIKREEYWD